MQNIATRALHRVNQERGDGRELISRGGKRKDRVSDDWQTRSRPTSHGEGRGGTTMMDVI